MFDRKQWRKGKNLERNIQSIRKVGENKYFSDELHNKRSTKKRILNAGNKDAKNTMIWTYKQKERELSDKKYHS